VPLRLDSVRVLIGAEAPVVFRPAAVGERRAFTLRKAPGTP